MSRGLTLALCIAAVAYANEAHAYVDQGTAGVAMQVLIAGAMGAMIGVKGFWRQISTFGSKIFRRAKDDKS